MQGKVADMYTVLQAGRAYVLRGGPRTCDRWATARAPRAQGLPPA